MVPTSLTERDVLSGNIMDVLETDLRLTNKFLLLDICLDAPESMIQV